MSYSADTNGPDMMTPVWILHGIRYNSKTREGLLMADGDRVRLTSGSETLFDVRRDEVRASWPWYNFGGVVLLQVGTDSHRIAFLGPSGGAAMGDSVKDLRVAAKEISAVRRARGSGRQWKELLNRRA